MTKWLAVVNDFPAPERPLLASMTMLLASSNCDWASGAKARRVLVLFYTVTANEGKFGQAFPGSQLFDELRRPARMDEREVSVVIPLRHSR